MATRGERAHEARSRDEIDDDEWLCGMTAIYDTAYLEGDNPRAQWADRIFVGNALTWQPPRRFDFVRTELVYVPAQRQRAFVVRVLDDVVAPGGRLITCGYGSPRSDVPTQPVRRIVRAFGFEPELELEAEAPEGGGHIVELTVIRAAS